jgi:hypothetical protein
VADCDDWAEPDSDWLRDWQELVPEDQREVLFGRRRADLVATDGTIVELQQGSVAAEEIIVCQDFYPPMIWIFDARDVRSSDRLNLRPRDAYTSFRWKHPRKSIKVCRQPIFLDIGGRSLFRVEKVHFSAPPHAGWGQSVTKAEMIKWLNGMEDYELTDLISHEFPTRRTTAPT